MTQKPIGYVELEWTCKRCGARNPGTQKKCSGCGAMMSEEDQFEAPVQQELMSEEEAKQKAKGGPDVHCPYCGARSPAGSEKCVQCGAALGDAKARAAGQVVGAFDARAAGEIACPYCATPNPPHAATCKKCGGALQKPATPAKPSAPKAAGIAGLGIGGLIFGGVALLLCICLAGYFLLGQRTTDAPAVVQSVAWQRTVEIMEERPVEHEDWQDEIPAGARTGSCTRKHRSTQSSPAPGAEEVCGTPYTVDQGDGTGKVVQDCEYKIYDDWCKYTVREWTVVNKAAAQGNDFNPQWPNVSLGAGQREGERSEEYVVTFRVEDKADTYQYKLRSQSEFSRFTLGSRWTLKVNTFGGVTGAEPAD